MSAPTRPRLRTLAAATAALTLAAGLVATGLTPAAVAPAAAAPVANPRTTSNPDGSDLGFSGSLSGEPMNGYRLYELPVDNLRNINAINDDGLVAGWKYTADEDVPVPFVWAPRLGVQELPHAPTKRWWVGAIDDAGVAYGTAGNASVVKWVPDDFGYYGEPQTLVAEGALGEAEYGVSVDAGNEHGDLVLGAGGGDYYLYSKGTTTKLEPLGGALSYGVKDITSDKTVVGWSSMDPDGHQGPEPGWNEPTVWPKGGGPQSLGFPPVIHRTAEAEAVNSQGETVVEASWGEAGSPGQKFSTFLRKKDASHTWLRPVDENLATALVRVRDLAEDGTSVGIYSDGASSRPSLDAAIWDENGRVQVMDELLDDVRQQEWHLAEAERISPDGVIAGVGKHNGAGATWLAVPVDPVVFVHGAGASSIHTYEGDTPTDELWMKCGEDRRRLSLWPADRGKTAPLHSGAVDALQHATCHGIGEWYDDALNVYGAFLDRLRGTYREYDRGTTPQLRQTAAGCDLTQRGATTPNLFVYAYDWRRDNGASATGLAKYVECVKKFWPRKKVDIVTHSMGSLVARRYVLDTGGDDVDRMITVGAPWLGAPKLVNVLQTGDFAKGAVNGPLEDIKYVVGSFPAAHQLAASRTYAAASDIPIFKESGWDVNGNKQAFESYSYDDVKSLLDAQNPTFEPGTTGDTFQNQPGQTDWRDDTSDVQYTHVVGLQAGAQSIGTTVASKKVVCSPLTFECDTKHLMTTELVCGDGTVPVVSALRAGKGVDYNAGDAEVLMYQSGSTDDNESVEHTGLTANPHVEDAILRRLLSMADGKNDDGTPVAQDHSWLTTPGFEDDSCFQPAVSGLQSPKALAAAAEASPYGADNPAPGTSLRYVSVVGGTDQVVTDSANHSTDPSSGASGTVPGVTHVRSAEDAGLMVMPASESISYTTSFVGTGDPLQVELLEGSQQHPTAAVRWTDVPVAAGEKVALATTADGRNVLRVDADGDGDPEQVVTPTVRLGGVDAADVTPPTVTGTKLVTAEGTRYALNGADDATGLAGIRYSTDGTTFRPYDGPLELDATTTPVLTAFATDRAGNRSAPYGLRLDELQAELFTSATVDPAPSATGWSAGPATVTLDAVAPVGGSAVASITYRTVGAAGESTKTVDAAEAELTIDAVGTSQVSYHATAEDGTEEPERTLQVRIDGAAPTASVKVPSSIVTDLPAIRGTAADDAAGVSRIEIELRNKAGESWDGAAWVPGESWLSTSGTTRWSRTTGLPAGDQLPTGAYRVRVRAADGSGRTAIASDLSFTVAPTLQLSARPLTSPTGDWASAAALNNVGQAAGVGRVGATLTPMTWENGTARVLPLSSGATSSEVTAIDDHGTVYGSQSAATGTQAVRWEHGAEAPTVLPALGSGSTARVTDATTDGQFAVGSATASPGGPETPVRWTKRGIETLPLPATASSGVANGVAADGSASGTVTLPSGSRAAYWPAEGGVRLIPTLYHDTITSATAMNDVGIVVGTATSPGGELSNLFVYEDDTVTYVAAGEVMPKRILAHEISNSGTIVGEYTLRTNDVTTPRAFIATQQTIEGRHAWSALELATQVAGAPVWKQSSARAVNDHGQVAGLQVSTRVYSEGFVATPAHAPIASGVAVATEVDEPVDVTFDAYDPDVADPVTLTVADGPEHGELGQVEDGRVTYTPAAGFEGVDRFTYVASDPEFASVPATVTVTVGRGDEGPGDPDPTDHPPTVAIVAPATGEEGSTIELHTDLADPEGKPLTAVWSVTGGVLSGSGTDVELTLPDGPAEVEVTVSTTDGAHTVSTRATIDVGNVAPTANAGNDVTVTRGVEVALEGAAADASPDDAADLTTAWDFGDGTAGSGVRATHAWTSSGTYQVGFTVTDKDGATTTDTLTVTVVDAPTGTPGRAFGAIWVTEGAAVLDVRSDGRTTSGTLLWVGKKGPFTAKLTSFSKIKAPSGKAAAWIEGSYGSHRVKVYVESGLALGHGDIFKLWIDGQQVTSTGKRVLGLVTIC